MIVGNVMEGRPKKTGEETIKDHMKRRNMKLKDAQEKNKWKCCCKLLFYSDDGHALKTMETSGS